MPVSTIFSTNVVTYLPGQVKQLKTGWIIEYYALNPITSSLERKRFRLNALKRRCRTQQEFKVAANGLLCELNVKLASGWSPFQSDTENSKEMVPIEAALNKYLKAKARDWRDATKVSYDSMIKILIDWLQLKNMADMNCQKFTSPIAQTFMDDLLERPKFNNNTYNTYLKRYRACFNWMVEHGYCVESPFEKIKTRQKQEKIRGLIPPEARDKVLRYVRASKFPNYEIVMHLVFTSLIRPTEIERIQIKDIDLINKCIHIPEEKAKTHKKRDAALSDACISKLIPLLAKGTQPDWYLLNSQYECGPEPCYHAMFKKHWMKIREDCGLPDEMQLYSLKDTGITEMLEAGVDIVAVKEAAGHADISTTNKYIGKRTERMIEEVRGANVSLETKQKVESAAVKEVAGHTDLSITQQYSTDSTERKRERVRIARVALG